MNFSHAACSSITLKAYKSLNKLTSSRLTTTTKVLIIAELYIGQKKILQHCRINIFYTFARSLTKRQEGLSRGVTGNTSDFGSEESRFEPWRDNQIKGVHFYVLLFSFIILMVRILSR